MIQSARTTESADATDRPTVSVVVPSFRRPDHLEACLRALAAQDTPPLETLVVSRRGDDLTIERCRALERELPITSVEVDSAGQVAALNAGLHRATGEIVAITDDDCRPHSNWLRAIAHRFAEDPRIGGVGGRDIVHHGDVIDGGSARRVGRVTWYGRHIGNHHLQAALQDVEFLKGANMAFRRELLDGFDPALRGEGAQVCNDMRASLSVVRRGYRLVYDPAVRVDHHPAPRFDADARDRRSLGALAAEQHNDAYVLLTSLPLGRAVVAVLYRLVVGNRHAPGLLLGFWTLARRSPRRDALRVLAAANWGRLSGILTARAKR